MDESDIAIELPEDILTREVRAVCARYRIGSDDARKFLEDHFYSRPDLLKRILKKYPDEDITRLRDYKTLVKGSRKEIYYHLRQYQPDKQKIGELKRQLEDQIRSGSNLIRIRRVTDELLLTHVSTKERFAHYPVFYKKFSEMIPPPRKILDIGCGLHPLSYQFENPEICPDIYVAVDKSREVIEILKHFSPLTSERLIPVCGNIAEIKRADYLRPGVEIYDIVIILKVIPVIHRQNRDILSCLLNLPARRMLITASTEAMTRRTEIRHREVRILREFARMAQGKIIGEFEIENEFGYLVET